MHLSYDRCHVLATQYGSSWVRSQVSSKPLFAVEFHNTALMTAIKGLLVRIKDNVSQLSDKETGVAVEKDEAQVYPDTLPEL